MYMCKYCERDDCDTDCYSADHHNGTSRRTAAEWRAAGAADAQAEIARLREYVDSIPVLLQENARLVRAMNNSPALAEAVRLATSKEREELRAALREACDLYIAAECVGPTRYEPARIRELQKLADAP